MSDDVIDRGDDFSPTGPDAAQEPQQQQADVKQAALDDAAKALDELDPAKAERDAKDDKEDEGERQRDDKGRFIPKDRFDEAVRKEREQKEALAARLKEYEAREAQAQLAANFDEANKQVKELIRQHTSLLADGELDKASDLMEKILELKDQISESKAAAKADAAKNAAKEEVRYDALVAKLETDYPQINPDAPEFDGDMVRKVQAYMTGLMQTQRMGPSAALKEAVETILGAARKPDLPNKEKAEELGMRRREQAVAKALDAKGKQPASTKDVGIDSDKMGGALDASAVMKMSWDEFVKLPDSKLAELRGDFIN